LKHVIPNRTTASVSRANLRCTRQRQVLPKQRYIPNDVVWHPTTKILVAPCLT